jgi:hypothetical protein
LAPAHGDGLSAESAGVDGGGEDVCAAVGAGGENCLMFAQAAQEPFEGAHFIAAAGRSVEVVAFDPDDAGIGFDARDG